MTIPTINPATAKFSWVDALANTDGSALQAGEITGYVIGVRSASAAGSVVGTYPANSAPVPATATSDAFTALNLTLKPDTYFAAVRSLGPVNSDWSSETEFTIAQPVPAPPTGFSVA